MLITGICGFVGCTVAIELAGQYPLIKIYGVDNFIRPGSEGNRNRLKHIGATLFHGDIRSASDLEGLPEVDWVIDAASNPSVMAGIDGIMGSRTLVEHNLIGTLQVLEYCKRIRAGFILLSTSRVYAINPLANLPLTINNGAFAPDPRSNLPTGLTEDGVNESFSTEPPLSLYGATKRASETIALEYGIAFGFPVWINRCGLLAGAGQFGRADQGIVAFWINSYLRRRPLRYIGFDGQGHQVRDCLHPSDLIPLIHKQMMAAEKSPVPKVFNVSGGHSSAWSLRQLSDWCASRFGAYSVVSDPNPRAYDIPWLVLDPGLAETTWTWKPQKKLEAIFEEIASHAEANPAWLELSAHY